MPLNSEIERPATPPALGRGLFLAVALLFGMVLVGVFWVWQRAHREQTWRDRVNAQETFQAPPPSAHR